MVESAVTDVVCPAVTTEYPDGLLCEQVGVFDYLAGESARLAGALLAVCKPLGFPLGSRQIYIDAFLAGSNELFAGFPRALSVVAVVEPFTTGGLYVCVAPVESNELFNCVAELCTALLYSEVHTEAELCVVLKQRVCPSGSVTCGVRRVGAGRCRTAVDGGTACCVCDYHSVAEELCYKLYIGSLAAACTCAGELEQRLEELASLDSILLEVGLLYGEL